MSAVLQRDKTQLGALRVSGSKGAVSMMEGTNGDVIWVNADISHMKVCNPFRGRIRA